MRLPNSREHFFGLKHEHLLPQLIYHVRILIHGVNLSEILLRRLLSQHTGIRSVKRQESIAEF